MKITLQFIVLISVINVNIYAQSYKDELGSFRKNYKQEFLKDDHSPLKSDDLKYLQFFEADESYRVKASFQKTPNAEPFDMATLNGKSKKYIEYGILSFKLADIDCSLKIYQSVALMNKEEYKEYMFIPFADKTNGKSTYSGGRYLDFRMSDIINNYLIIDFNKAYNPYCAYSSGYNCPKPPEENALPLFINAGEKQFGKDTHE